MTPADPAPGSLTESIARWRDMDFQLTALRRKLEHDDGDEAVPSYRVGAAEGFSTFEGLGPLGDIVDESFRLLAK